jgi:tetratricopeptide (TPR) repeat protein
LRKLFAALLVVLFLAVNSYATVKVDVEAKLFQKGLQQFKIGSYSTALEYFIRALKPGSKYYKKALFMLAKTYYAIGKKLGNKQYLWQALNYLELYFIAVGNHKLPWDYYYLRAQIYESLSFYEQALALYRVAFLAAKTEQQRIETTIGIVRTAVWVRRPDIVDEYYILISTAKLTPQQEREVEFVRGLVLFSQGKYREALPYFFRLYKLYESYLIDNPEYYFLVAEDIYRLGNLNLAEQLFQRIVSLTRDPEVIRKAYLRLGDIELRRKNLKLAFVYYYTVISDYPNSQEAIVARLKIIPLLKNPVVKYRAMLSKDSAFKDPVKYVAQVLVNYRTTYVGIYALADLGYLVFNLGSPETVFKRLTWEVSLVFPEEVKYEQREFLRYLWTPYLLKLPYKKGCQLYRSNPRFFQELFGKRVLLKFASDLKACNMRRLRVELFKYMVSRWHDDASLLMMAEALFEDRDFRGALKVLKKVKNKNSCDYRRLLLKLALFIPVKGIEPSKFVKECPIKGLESTSLAIYYLSKSGNIESAFQKFREAQKELVRKYKKELVVRAAVDRLMESALEREDYAVLYKVASALLKAGVNDCVVGSYYTIAAVRLGLLNEASKEVKAIKGCVDSLSTLAKAVYDDSLLEEELRDGAVLSGVKKP